MFYTIPMVIEESSVVAAASKAAKYWLERGGFKTKVISTTKVGHVHFKFAGDSNKLDVFFDLVRSKLQLSTKALIKNMERRGGGITGIELIDKNTRIRRLLSAKKCLLRPKNAMGANLINSCLEQLAKSFKLEAKTILKFF